MIAMITHVAIKYIYSCQSLLLASYKKKSKEKANVRLQILIWFDFFRQILVQIALAL